MARVTASLPGTGGLTKLAPEDFFVEELPAYLPAGEGPHTYLFIEKRGLTTEEAVVQLCRALGVPRDQAGVAGMKDRQAVTRQWVSLLEAPLDHAKTLSLPGVTVLSASRHGNKLRTGHLRGNRFVITLRGVGDREVALGRARAVLDALVASGLPNRYGPQRFGARGDNAARGKALLTDGDRGARRIGRGERRLLVSAFQSELFNQVLDARVADGLLRRALVGDVLRKRDSGGLFAVDEAGLADAQGRLDAQALDVTGPMFGHKMKAPPEGTEAAAREAAVLSASGVTHAQWAALGPIAEGTRRPFTVPVEDPSVAVADDGTDALVLSFTLPAGAYATVLLDEVAKPG